MKRKEMIKEIYRVAGLLEGLSIYLQRNTSEAAVTMLGDCVDRLEIVGAQLMTKDVNDHETTEAFGRVYPSPVEEGTD
jgi:hypothetical protein